MARESADRTYDKLGLRSRLDFVLHLPSRYEDETTLTELGSAPPGRPVLVEAKVLHTDIVFRPRRQLVVHCEGLVLRFFNFWGSQKKQFEREAEKGKWVRAFGEVRSGFFGSEMAHPRYKFVDPGEPLPQTLTPIYPTTAGLAQEKLRARVLEALDSGTLEDTLSDTLRSRYGLAPFAESVRVLHRPPPGADLAALAGRSHPAWRRMKFDELLAQQLSMKLAYAKRRSRAAPPLPAHGPLLRGFMHELPFRLTGAQTRALNEVLRDLAQPHPMQRLLQGDVGSGKTIVAAIACLAAVDAGWQAAVMAPTEILSEQHWRKFSAWFEPRGVRIGWLHAGVPKRERRAMLEAPIVIGTHALIQEGAALPRLGLAVVDEQHRFGVRQRLDLRRKAEEVFPHQLMMSATPIPRTLSMTYYADLDVSVINEMPPGRRPAMTKLFSDRKRGEVLARIREACAEGEQAYWVCPLIGQMREESKASLQTALETYERLRSELKKIKVELLHGRMKSEEKAAVMQRFQAGATQLLVCTTVIEVGVDVPNASLMVIESAERFGLAQLHQLRGRIGRGRQDSTCILLYGEPLQGHAKERLKIIYENTDGFLIAQKDLELRGPGEVLGERQSGEPLLRFADLEKDADLVEAAMRAATELLEQEPRVARAHVARWLASRQDLGNA